MRHSRSRSLVPHRLVSHSVWVLALGAICVAVSCAGTKPVTPPPVAAPPAQPLILVEPAPDLSEVAEPPDLIGIVRVRNLEALARTVGGWVGIPLDPRMIIERLDSSLLPAALALDAPIDVVVALDPSKQGFHAPFAVFSLPVRSFDDAKQAAQGSGRLHEVRPGVFRLRMGGGATCVLAASAGAMSGRIVCGDEQPDLDALLDYTVRTLPGKDFGPSDLHAELRLLPIEQRFGPTVRQSLGLGFAVLVQQMETGDGALDRVMMMASDAIAQEVGHLFDDFDAVGLDAGVADDQATVHVRFKVRGAQSWSMQVLEQASRNAATPPSLAWALPLDAASAQFAQPIGVDQFDGVRRAAGMLLNGWMAHDRVSSRDRAAVVDLFDKPFMGDGPIVAAEGPRGTAPPSAPPSWSLLGLGVPPQLPVSTVKKLVSVWSRPGIQTWLKATLSKLGEPIGKEGPWRAVSASPTLPKGALAFESTWTPLVSSRPTPGSVGTGNRSGPHGAPVVPRVPDHKTPNSPPPHPLSVYLMVVPAGGATWIGWGTDKEAVAIHLRTALAGQAGTTGGSGLESLRRTPLLWGGFISVRGLLESIASSASSDRRMRAAMDGLDSLPHRAQDRIVFADHPIDPETKTYDFEMRIPKAAIEDLAAAAIRGVALHGASPNFLAPPPEVR